MNHLPVVIVILLASNLPVTCVSLGRACAVLPPASLWFRSLDSFPDPEAVLPTAGEWACSSCCPSLFARAAREQRFAFLVPACDCCAQYHAVQPEKHAGWSQLVTMDD